MVARKSVVIGGGWLSRLEGYCARKTNVSGEWTAEVPTPSSSETASVLGREPIKKRPLFGATLFKEAKLAGSQKRLVWRRVGDVQRQ
jgi:hypothetical protein